MLVKWSRLCPISNIRLVLALPVHENPNNSQNTLTAVNSAADPTAEGPRHRYAEYLREHYAMHQEFWYRNNQRFELAKQQFTASQQQSQDQISEEAMAEFYRKYLLENQEEFAAYHRMSWKSAFRLLWEEYRYTFCTMQTLFRRRRPTTSANSVSSFLRHDHA